MEEEANDQRVVVLGVGNVLMRDDALGPYVVHLLEARYVFPPSVEVIDGGTPGLDFLPYLDGARAVIVVDTVSSEGEAGTLRLYRRKEFLARPMPPRVTPHQPGIREAMMAAELMDSAPEEFVLIGVIPEDMELGTRLTSPVQDAVEPAIEAVVQELLRLGVPPKRRRVPLEDGPWWQEEIP